MDSVESSRIRKGNRNFSTLCRFMGCQNGNHRGFITVSSRTACQWIEWFKEEGVEIDVKKVKRISICFRHFRRKDMRLTDAKFQRVVLNKFSKPVYGYGDVITVEDQAFHDHINKLLDDRLRNMQCKNNQQHRGLKRKPITPKEVDESDESDDKLKVKEKKKFHPELTTEGQVKPRKRKLVEPFESQEYLTLKSLVTTASTIKKDFMAAQKLVVVDTTVHEILGKKDDEGNFTMLEIREALLRHDWDLALQLLPHLFLKVDCLNFIWQSYLQIFCHHPNTSPELLRELLQSCLQTSTITTNDLKEVFCLRRESDSKEFTGEENEKVDLKLKPKWFSTASVVHKLASELH